MVIKSGDSMQSTYTPKLTISQRRTPKDHLEFTWGKQLETKGENKKSQFVKYVCKGSNSSWGGKIKETGLVLVILKMFQL